MTSIPEWPDFSLVFDYDKDCWVAATDTGRPKTPIFNLIIKAHEDIPEDIVRQFAREDLDKAFARAHPDGCPGSH